MMRVAHLAPARKSSGSAAWRILEAQRSAGIDAFAVVHSKAPQYAAELIFPNMRPTNLLLRNSSRISSLIARNAKRGSFDAPWSIGWPAPPIARSLSRMDFDVLNIHWLPSCVGLTTLAKLGKPIVLTLHDVWPLTGGCHCNFECSQWSTGCHDCPQTGSVLGIYPLSQRSWSRKQNAYESVESLTVVAPSEWIAEMARKSPLFSGRDISHVPNCVDGQIFEIKSKEQSKLKFGLPLDKICLLFSVAGSVHQYHKGFDLLVDALQELPLSMRPKLHLLVVGEARDLGNLPFPHTSLGTVKSEIEMSDVYNAADIFVGPSRQENLPNSFIEASMCGALTVGFDVGGIPEIVDHGKSGYIAESFSIKDLARGIQFCVDRAEDSAVRDMCSSAVREKFSTEVTAGGYKNLYREILGIENGI